MKTLCLALCFLAGIHATHATANLSKNLRKIAGEYYFSDGLGANGTLRLDAGGGFKFGWRGCAGVYDENRGLFTIQDGRVVLAPASIHIRGGFRGAPTEYFLVPWGPRTYLVPTNAMIEFCSDVNQGTEPRSAGRGLFYLRKGDPQWAATGRPEVPAAWKPYLLRSPVNGMVTEIIDAREAWVDRGSKHGVLPGMILTARGGSQISQVRVEAVEKRRCRVKCQWNNSELVVGQPVSSLFYN